jgi:hypothetical protein
LNKNENKTNHRSKGVIMLKKNEENSFKLSYESDGKMGKKDKNTEKKKDEAEMFFNNTQDSE